MGFKLHLIVNDSGEVLASRSRRATPMIANRFPTLAQRLFGKCLPQRLHLPSLSSRCGSTRMQLITGLRAKMKEPACCRCWTKVAVRKRLSSETINDQLKKPIPGRAFPSSQPDQFCRQCPGGRDCLQLATKKTRHQLSVHEEKDLHSSHS